LVNPESWIEGPGWSDVAQKLLRDLHVAEMDAGVLEDVRKTVPTGDFAALPFAPELLRREEAVDSVFGSSLGRAASI
jgi:hypothetical protein